jgi:tetratricopeptide (TPR) repeat protein
MDVNATSRVSNPQLLLIVLGVLISIHTSFAADDKLKPAFVPPRFELFGEIRIGTEQKSKKSYAFVGLTGNLHPYSASGWTDLCGSFRFHNLEAGSYTLVAEVNKRAEQRMTLEISPALADEKGRILKVIILNPSSFHSVRKKPQVVSWKELAIPPKAQNEYSHANDALIKGQIENGIQHLEMAIQLAPQFITALNRLGSIYYFRKDYAKAEEVFRRALMEDPKAYEPLVNLGETLLSEGKPEEALPYNLKAMEAQSSDAMANALLGLNYVALHEDDQAVGYLIRTKQLDPLHYSRPQLTLAGIYERKSQSDLALRELEEFLRLHPDYSENQQILQQMVQIKGKAGE